MVWRHVRYRREGRGSRSETTLQELHTAVSGRTPRGVLACRDGLRLPRSEALPTIVGNRAVDDGAAVNALPGVEDEEEIGEPF